MKHLLLCILLLIGTTVVAQPYGNITSDWCKMGLNGKVKKQIVNYKYIYPNSDPAHTQVPETNKQFEFSPTGYLLKQSIGYSCKYKVGHYKYLIKHENIIGREFHYINTRGMREGIDTCKFSSFTDTSFTEHTKNSNAIERRPTETVYTYNNKKRIKRITTIYQGDIIETKSFNYDANGQIVAIHIITNLGNKSHEVYTVIARDSKNNPTEIDFENIAIKSLTKRKYYISYTYYD